ncbi:MAG: phosphoadenylyl-sulfate reductase [Luteolibacter sp.]
MPDVDPGELSSEIASVSAGERIRKLHSLLGDHLVATTSFGIQSAVMLHLIHEHAPEIPVVFIDTGYLFPETYRYIEQLSGLLEKLDLRIYQPAISSARMEALWGRLWEGGKEDMDRYAMITKIEPMNRALQELGADVWLSGLRRSQSKTRGDRPFVERQKKTLKAYPILDWADIQVEYYMQQHDLPRHPLLDRGYLTTGDWHSTMPASEGTSEGTRFRGMKYECGLHLESGSADFQI